MTIQKAEWKTEKSRVFVDLVSDRAYRVQFLSGPFYFTADRGQSVKMEAYKCALSMLEQTMNSIREAIAELEQEGTDASADT